MDQLFGMAQPASPMRAAAPHAAYKIPSGDGPYARAKHFQVKLRSNPLVIKKLLLASIC
jgi:hypothetical protein